MEARFCGQCKRVHSRECVPADLLAGTRRQVGSWGAQALALIGAWFVLVPVSLRSIATSSAVPALLGVGVTIGVGLVVVASVEGLTISRLIRWWFLPLLFAIGSMFGTAGVVGLLLAAVLGGGCAALLANKKKTSQAAQVGIVSAVMFSFALAGTTAVPSTRRTSGTVSPRQSGVVLTGSSSGRDWAAASISERRRVCQTMAGGMRVPSDFVFDALSSYYAGTPLRRQHLIGSRSNRCNRGLLIRRPHVCHPICSMICTALAWSISA